MTRGKKWGAYLSGTQGPHPFGKIHTVNTLRCGLDRPPSKSQIVAYKQKLTGLNPPTPEEIRIAIQIERLPARITRLLRAAEGLRGRAQGAALVLRPIQAAIAELKRNAIALQSRLTSPDALARMGTLEDQFRKLRDANIKLLDELERRRAARVYRKRLRRGY